MVNEHQEQLAEMQEALPEDVQLSLEFDQSPYVTGAMSERRAVKACIGAVLTGLMVLLFLRDWRSVIVVVLTIPLSLIGRLIGLWLTGQTINLMTLGGLSLAVGILVDEAHGGDREHPHANGTQADRSPGPCSSGHAETAVPRLLAMLCILAVFLPSFLMEGAARGLFVPLALAVGFAMVTAYYSFQHLCAGAVGLASEASPRGRGPEHGLPGTVLCKSGRLPAPLALAIGRGLRGGLRWLCLAGAGPFVGTEIFPVVDAGQFQLRLRAATGTNITRTEQLTLKAWRSSATRWGRTTSPLPRAIAG